MNCVFIAWVQNSLSVSGAVWPRTLSWFTMWALREPIRFTGRNYYLHGPPPPAPPPPLQGGRFSCFSLMEKASGMKFPPTADSFKPSKRSARFCWVNRWGWRAEDGIQMRNRWGKTHPQRKPTSIFAGKNLKKLECVMPAFQATGLQTDISLVYVEQNKIKYFQGV